MGDVTDDMVGATTFAFTWIGVAFVACVAVGVLAGLVRGEVGETLGFVVQWGMTGTSILLVAAIAWRKT